MITLWLIRNMAQEKGIQTSVCSAWVNCKNDSNIKISGPALDLKKKFFLKHLLFCFVCQSKNRTCDISAALKLCPLAQFAA